ncbi:hypothetical protein LY78DRAFT_267362 [Colletotrichum sublineola]|nr:hypothetical protein LY78DRAFT_267362 [Colletotrichum sublineola]
MPPPLMFLPHLCDPESPPSTTYRQHYDLQGLTPNQIFDDGHARRSVWCLSRIKVFSETAFHRIHLSRSLCVHVSCVSSRGTLSPWQPQTTTRTPLLHARGCCVSAPQSTSLMFPEPKGGWGIGLEINDTCLMRNTISVHTLDHLSYPKPSIKRVGVPQFNQYHDECLLVSFPACEGQFGGLGSAERPQAISMQDMPFLLLTKFTSHVRLFPDLLDDRSDFGSRYHDLLMTSWTDSAKNAMLSTGA